MNLTKKELFAFAFLNIPLSLGGLPLGLYLTPYYASELGFSLATIGLILMLTRVTDVITDPLIGTLSDRTPARYGRRSIWIIIGMPVMAVTEGKPASVGGIQKNDIIIFIEGKSVGNIYDYMSRLGPLKEGMDIVVTVKRGEDTLDLVIRL